ncbi:DinB family protein [Geodermatophilus sp. SYSU D00742]
MDEKATLHSYLRRRRADLLGKLDGLDEYSVRRPMTRTGTNLLGLVEHVAYVQLGYFGEVLGRPSGVTSPWEGDGAEDDADMWVPAGELREDVVELYRFSAAHADATIEALPLDAVGEVPWWPQERRHPTLHTLLVHTCVEVARHAGHADVVRESIDGVAGMSAADANLPERSDAEWAAFRDRIEAAARQAARGAAARQAAGGATGPTGVPPGDG